MTYPGGKGTAYQKLINLMPPHACYIESHYGSGAVMRPPLELHDYAYLGDNYRERERIKRKKTRWVAKLRGMDELERRAILWAIRESGVMG